MLISGNSTCLSANILARLFAARWVSRSKEAVKGRRGVSVCKESTTAIVMTRGDVFPCQPYKSRAMSSVMLRLLPSILFCLPRYIKPSLPTHVRITPPHMNTFLGVYIYTYNMCQNSGTARSSTPDYKVLSMSFLLSIQQTSTDILKQTLQIHTPSTSVES
jgi:hypothetical protein